MEPVTIKVGGRERKVPYPEAFIQVIKDKALKGDPRAAQILINLLKELNLLKSQARLEPFTIVFSHPADQNA